jgi:integrase
MSDGLRRTGSKDGLISWEARIVARHPDTGQKLIDTTRTLWAKDKAEALTAKDKLRTELVDARLGRVQKARILFCDAADAWLETITRYGSQKTYRTHVKNLKLRFGPTWLDAIDVDDMQRHLAAMSKQFSPSVVGGHRTVLVNVWEWACDEGYLRRPNLAAQTRLRAAKKAQVTGDAADPDKRDMTPEELGRFMPALEARDPIMAKLVLAMLVLGARFAETSALKRSDVDWTTGRVVIRRGQVDTRLGPPKGNKSRVAAFPAAALEALRGHVAEMDRLQWPGHEEWLFPCRPNVRRRRPLPLWNIETVGKAMRETMRANGIHTVNATHVCRHTLIGLMRGEAAAAVMRSVVGHADEKTNAKYGAAKVIAFAAKVERVVMRPAKAAKKRAVKP